MKRLLCTLASLLLLASTLHAQDISGDWQGAAGAGKERQRIVLHIEKAASGGWKATLYAIDIQQDGVPVTLTQHGAALTVSYPKDKLSYKATLSPDGKSIAGTLDWDGTAQLTLVHPTREAAWPYGPHCACKASFVSVEKDVRLEVLDWGGTGRPLILLAGLGNTAHDFEDFAHKLIGRYHVYGITRRGYGKSSVPTTEASYRADRLGDDVLAVIEALHLRQRPVLVGHSIAGEELSSVGSRHPEKVAALIYLDAAYQYAFYSPTNGNADLDVLEVRRELGDLILKDGLDDKKIAELLQQLPELEKKLQQQQQKVIGLPKAPHQAAAAFRPSDAILLGQQKYTKIPCAILAIYADPHDLGPMKKYTAAQITAETKFMNDHTTNLSRAFETGNPSAKVVRIPNADHFVFESNEAEVLREMDAFLATLPD